MRRNLVNREERSGVTCRALQPCSPESLADGGVYLGALDRKSMFCRVLRGQWRDISRPYGLARLAREPRP